MYICTYVNTSLCMYMLLMSSCRGRRVFLGILNGGNVSHNFHTSMFATHGHVPLVCVCASGADYHFGYCFELLSCPCCPTQPLLLIARLVQNQFGFICNCCCGCCCCFIFSSCKFKWLKYKSMFAFQTFSTTTFAAIAH